MRTANGTAEEPTSASQISTGASGAGYGTEGAVSRSGAGTVGALDAGKETCGVASGWRLTRRPWSLSFVILVMTGALASGFALALGQLSFVLFVASKALGSG